MLMKIKISGIATRNSQTENWSSKLFVDDNAFKSPSMGHKVLHLLCYDQNLLESIRVIKINENSEIDTKVERGYCAGK